MLSLSTKSKLAALFLISFGIPLVLGVAAKSIFASSAAGKNEAAVKDDFFSNPIRFRGDGSYLTVADHESLNPKLNKDFLFEIWFRLPASTDEGARDILFLKYNSENKNHEGYGLSISNEKGELYPELYWMNSEGKGGWFRFTELKIEPRSWNVIVGVVQKGRSIGLYGGTVRSKNEHDVDLLGGYEIDDANSVQNDAALIIGSQAQRPLHGTIGLFGIASGELGIENLNDFVKLLVKKKEDAKFLFDKKDLSFWLTGDLKDQSEFHHEVKPYRVRVG
jgi:hypothetical protein